MEATSVVWAEAHEADIDGNPWQPRLTIDQDYIRELADSIAQVGLLQNLLARRIDGRRYQLAFGHMRLEAIKLLIKDSKWVPEAIVPLEVRDLSDEDMALVALIENNTRRDITPLETYRAYQKAIAETALTVVSLAKQVGMDHSTLSNNLRVLELPSVVLDRVASGEMPLTSAREFLVLQNQDHVHLPDMQGVISYIASMSAPLVAPDWSRRNVRELIAGAVQGNDAGWRPLAPRQGNATHGQHFEQGFANLEREPAFDISDFRKDHPAAFHTIPARRGDGSYENSRVWTCDVAAWRKAQAAATRATNKAAEEAGKPRPAGTTPRGPSRPQRLSEALAKDPVAISLATEAPVGSDIHKADLGTRAELQHVTYDSPPFYKLLQLAGAGQYHDYHRDRGGSLPPWFPDIEECTQRCNWGAGYATGQGYDKPDIALYCFNKDHWQEKEARGRETWEAQLNQVKEAEASHNTRLVHRLDTISALPPALLRILLQALLLASERYHSVHPVGGNDQYSYDHSVIIRARDILGLPVEQPGWWVLHQADALEALSQVPDQLLAELLGCLMVYHFRVAKGQVLQDVEALLKASKDDPLATSLHPGGHQGDEEGKDEGQEWCAEGGGPGARIALPTTQLAQLLLQWVATQQQTRRLLTSKLSSELQQLATAQDLAWPYKSPISFGMHLSATLRSLSAQFDVQHTHTKKGEAWTIASKPVASGP